MGIYVIVTPGGARAAVIASGADEAAKGLARHFAETAGIPVSAIDETTYRVGRLGDLNPGMQGQQIINELPGLYGVVILAAPEV